MELNEEQFKIGSDMRVVSLNEADSDKVSSRYTGQVIRDSPSLDLLGEQLMADRAFQSTQTDKGIQHYLFGI